MKFFLMLFHCCRLELGVEQFLVSFLKHEARTKEGLELYCTTSSKRQFSHPFLHVPKSEIS